MIERHITFNVHPDRTAAFEAFFAEQYRPAMSAAPGFVKVDLLRELDQATRYQMVLRWDSAEAAAGWRTSDVHQALQPALTALYADNEISAFEVLA
jgi:heme-degrading monooxygenase HmoA